MMQGGALQFARTCFGIFGLRSCEPFIFDALLATARLITQSGIGMMRWIKMVMSAASQAGFEAAQRGDSRKVHAALNDCLS